MARKVISAYAISTSLWILLPDEILSPLIKDATFKAFLATIRVWALIPIASGLLYVLLRRRHQALETNKRSTQIETLAQDMEPQYRLLFTDNPNP
ncbi:MAG: hypothetical protein JOZ78_04205, partial [Chroococcidiopsidaceae cyanobacterium CP_BM_ER_R8_30]|nr:hypothetical protein [Chroococcidiopsidaceae cyanobacterium CP_BM_ER_R8_30]